MRAIIGGQLVAVEVLKEKKTLFGEKVLVSFKSDEWTASGRFMYSVKAVKWIKKKDLIEDKHV